MTWSVTSLTAGWRYDPSTGFLDVKFPHGDGSTTVTFGVE